MERNKMDIIVTEPRLPPAEDRSAALKQLLTSCIGYPRDCDKVLNEKHKQLFDLKSLKIAADERYLGASYWVHRDALMKMNKLKVFASGLMLEPATMPGQWNPQIQTFYEHSTKKHLIGVPRFFGLSAFGAPQKDLRTTGLEILSKYIDLRDLQIEASKESLKRLYEWGGATMIADCGFGKTRVALDVISKLGRRAIILCNREVLMQQWADVIRELVPEWRISWLKGSNTLDKKRVREFLGPSESCDVCIASIETLLECDMPNLNSYGTVVIDECHHIAAASLVHALPKLPMRYIFGLSATPNRRDGLEHAIYWLCGPASFVYKRLPSITGLRDTVEVRKTVFKDGLQVEKMYPNGQLAFAEMTTSLTKDPKRNKLILDTIVNCVNEARQKIIVVSALVDHCTDLHQLITEHTGFSADVPCALMAGPTVQTVKAKDPGTRVVFATYSMLEEGYDDPWLDTLLLVTPRSRIQQVVGRIERSRDNKLRPLVFDFVDSFSIWPNMWYKRKSFYASRGFEINEC
jgi:superfamily II DNA or RNA helicase